MNKELGEKWYLVQCKAKESFRACQHLTQQGFECCHPTMPTKQTKANPKGEGPLFPYYLFVKANQELPMGKIRSTRGVLRIVGAKGTPLTASQQLIDELTQRSEWLWQQPAQPEYSPGDRVTINQGCFAELEAIVKTQNSQERVILLLNLLNREVTVEMPIAQIS
ncbi:transcription termination/antitermination NusG family protein [Bermanella sp. R86510]|uniref:transcription termination/antitermination NusG family protein n=1 Tax=unclassified Bermanella TaxID=2627862 RepID=UPI0037C6835A